MIITHSFSGANITVKRIDGDTVYLENQIRDTTEDWFYWAFRVDRANGRTVRFVFDKMRVGYFGAAKSRDLENWEWTGSWDDDRSFTYTFDEDEDTVYFAHNMIYSPDMLAAFCNRMGITPSTLCSSQKGRSVPYIELGNGEEILLLTARHHACESTGSYVLEGVLERYIENPIKGLRIVCVPFVDYDGVVDGDQGKSRAPHDHNRDYTPDSPSIYRTVAAIRGIAKENRVRYAFDFHSPWHIGNENDSVFIVRNSIEKDALIGEFSQILESCITADSLPYKSSNDLGADVSWNKLGTPTFGNYMLNTANAEIAFSFETAYFTAQGTPFSQKAARELGRCYLEAVRKFYER